MRSNNRLSKKMIAAIVALVSLSLLAVAQSRVARKAVAGNPAPPPAVKSAQRPAVRPSARPAEAAGVAVRNPQTAGQTLPLRRVILYSNGVAYFERRGMVTGRTEINLAFKQSQVDDVLKSLVVLDLGKGRIGAVSYNSSAPPSARLNEIPFSIDPETGGEEAGGLAKVLSQFQGARVAITTNNRTVTGAIITIGERQIPTEKDKPPIKTHTLVVSSESGELQSFDLNEVRAVKLLDEGARSDIKQFSDASASARRRDAKTITVTSEGEGQREMVISYTIATPIWKTTYRVVLDEAGKPFFQGWAVVDNVGEEDWENISLSLVSGTPVSFIHEIQKPLYRYRPVIPIPADLNLTPQPYEPDVAAGSGNDDGIANLPVNGRMRLPETNVFSKSGALNLSPGVVQQRRQEAKDQAMVENRSDFAATESTLGGAITSGESGVDTAATGNEVGELFEYRVGQPVTVRRDRSALIPILQTKMEGERVSVYNEASRKDRPMHGIRLKNTSDLTLEGGSLTVLDGDAYAGEALIERLKANEQRFISFGLDLGTLVTTRLDGQRRPVHFIRAYKGIFEAHYYLLQKKTYTIVNQTDRKRTIYIEHPLRPGWVLSNDTQKPASQTTSFYRFRVEIEPRATVKLPISETQALLETYQISNLTPRDLEIFVSGNYIDAKLRTELEKILEIKTNLSRTQDRINALDKEEREIGEDQKRLRENIGALKNTGDAKQLVLRYISKADQQETRLEQISKEKRDAQAELARQTAELEVAVKSLNLERSLID